GLPDAIPVREGYPVEIDAGGRRDGAETAQGHPGAGRPHRRPAAASDRSLTDSPNSRSPTDEPGERTVSEAPGRCDERRDDAGDARRAGWGGLAAFRPAGIAGDVDRGRGGRGTSAALDRPGDVRADRAARPESKGRLDSLLVGRG